MFRKSADTSNCIRQFKISVQRCATSCPGTRCCLKITFLKMENSFSHRRSQCPGWPQSADISDRFYNTAKSTLGAVNHLLCTAVNPHLIQMQPYVFQIPSLWKWRSWTRRKPTSRSLTWSLSSTLTRPGSEWPRSRRTSTSRSSSSPPPSLPTATHMVNSKTSTRGKLF